MTGGANGIGKCIAEEFAAKGATVYVIDIAEGDHFVGDISRKDVLEAFAEKIEDNEAELLPDQAALIDLMIDVFYEEVPQEAEPEA